MKKERSIDLLMNTSVSNYKWTLQCHVTPEHFSIKLQMNTSVSRYTWTLQLQSQVTHELCSLFV